MVRYASVLVFFIISIIHSTCFSQSWSSPLKIFGFFQNSFNQESRLGGIGNRSTFNSQQLNIFLQKDLAQNWTSFINLEMLNNFSSSRQWGSFNLEEAWVKYKNGPKFNLKIGLQIPIFNNLNEIKNKTPLIPYIVRPLVYETSYGEFLNLEHMVPGRTFVQTYGFFPIAKVKLDYALYLGNSPNINDKNDRGQTGVDTTDTYLIGGRLGIRYRDIKTGLSATFDKINELKPAEPFLNLPDKFLEEVPRYRLGGNFSWDVYKFRLETEFIAVKYDDDVDEINLDKWFYYYTLGYFMTEQVFIYYSYWYSNENATEVYLLDGKPQFQTGKITVLVPTVGLAYNITDRITMKGQFAQADINLKNIQHGEDDKVNYFSLAISIFF